MARMRSVDQRSIDDLFASWSRLSAATQPDIRTIGIPGPGRFPPPDTSPACLCYDSPA